jgi:hypothetical protein
MTDAEFDEVVQAIREHRERTSFPAPNAWDDEYECRSHHMEFEAARH